MSTVPNEPAADVVKIDLSAGSIHTALLDGQPHVVLRPAVEDLGLDFRTQLRKLRTRSWAVVGSVPTTGADGKTYDMAAVPVRTFLMLLASINENRVRTELRDTLVAFQNETADAIEAYWTRGAAINPRADGPAMELALRVISLQDRVAALTASNSSLVARCEEVSVKAEAYDDLIACEGVFELDAAAKILGPVTGNAGPERFINMLRGMEILYQRSKLPRQEHITRGYFAVRTEAEDGKAHPVTVVTMKGLSWLQAEFRDEHPTLTRVVDTNVRQLPRQERGELA